MDSQDVVPSSSSPAERALARATAARNANQNRHDAEECAEYYRKSISCQMTRSGNDKYNLCKDKINAYKDCIKLQQKRKFDDRRQNQ